MKKRKRSYHESRPKSQATIAPLEVTIERILPGGAGLAHAEGLTILVGLAAPGDRLRVKVDRKRGSVAFASIIEIIEPSPARVSPPCPYFGHCGGCDFQQLDYKAQLSAKVEIIRDCLRRIARIDFPQDIPITPSPDAWRYRSRAQWQFDARQKLFGYFERGTHNICDVASCPVLAPALEEKLEELRERVRQGQMPREVGEFQAVAGDEGASVFPPFDEEETREVSRRIGDYLYRFSAEGFFQINQALLPALIDAAIAEARGEHALDLYCGAGLFTLPLSKRFARVTGVEAHAGAVASGLRNLAHANASNAHLECSLVGEWLHQHASSLAPLDFILLDPPRSGTEDGVIAGILAARPQNISYVSCDPATLARDLLSLQTGGYQLDSIHAFDMFPQTHHVETVAHLSPIKFSADESS
ncbi:MAG: class I SAM-dependent RNA methyltransferase [Acidobacteria bacterium]|nr:class I SAM-dependent RNA methyltransferase [Acidobacteriota bacterium]